MLLRITLLITLSVFIREAVAQNTIRVERATKSCDQLLKLSEETKASSMNFGNDSLTITGRCVNQATGAKLSGASVYVFQEEQFVQKITTSASGKYRVVLPLDKAYAIYYCNGDQLKWIELDLKQPETADVLPNPELSIEMAFYDNLNEEALGLLRTKPVGRANLDPYTGELKWDYPYSANQRKELERMMENK